MKNKILTIILWVLLMIAVLGNMSLQNKVDKLEKENYELRLREN